jgi:hypothetical protein
MKTVGFLIGIQLILQSLFPGAICAAGIVCLYDSTDIEIKRNLTAVVKIYKDYEITSEEGLSQAEFAAPVNNYIEFSDLKGYTELPDGKGIKINEKDFMILTGRMDREFGGKKAVLFSLKSPAVGARLHYEYRLDIKNLLYLPRITRQDSYPVKRMSVRLRWPGNVNLFHDYQGFESLLSKRNALFYADNLPEIHGEPYSCKDELYLYLSADRFKFAGKEYKCAGWPEVGLFFNEVSRQPNSAAAAAGRLARTLLKSSISFEDTLKSLFDFVADSVAYVALRVGSGDFVPHDCGQIIERRFGDCKDQTILLGSLCRSAGLEAYPALISTADYPDIRSLHPWPAVFDHTLVVVKHEGNEYILDPGDPFSDVSRIPPRLRGKHYLIADNSSALSTIPDGPDPAEWSSWDFHTIGDSTGAKTGFTINYYHDSALRLGRILSDYSGSQKSEFLRGALSRGAWRMTSLEIQSESFSPDTVSISGEFFALFSDADSSTGFAVGSPLVAYLLDNIFTGIRQGPFCRKSSLRLEEQARLSLMKGYSFDMPEYRDFWIREGLEFYDEIKYIGDDIIFRRVFDLDGTEISSDDFNAFRDFLLSRRNQRYVPASG